VLTLPFSSQLCFDTFGGLDNLLPALAAEFIAGLQFMAAAVANRQQRCPAIPAEFVINRIFNMAFGVIHLLNSMKKSKLTK
jgi:hypothetical protein